MLDGRQIREMQLKAARKAQRLGLVPVEYQGWDAENREAQEVWCGQLPFIGDHVPDGYEEDGAPLFVDSSGFGRVGEPALTQEQFMDKLEVGKYYAIIDAGEFQVYVGVFKKKEVK